LFAPCGPKIGNKIFLFFLFLYMCGSRNKEKVEHLLGSKFKMDELVVVEYLQFCCPLALLLGVMFYYSHVIWYPPWPDWLQKGDEITWFNIMPAVWIVWYLRGHCLLSEFTFSPSKQTGATCGAGTAHPSISLEFTPLF